MSNKTKSAYLFIAMSWNFLLVLCVLATYIIKGEIRNILFMIDFPWSYIKITLALQFNYFANDLS